MYGHLNTGSNTNGAGIMCLYSSPLIRNCIIMNCYAYNNGGGIGLEFSDAEITDCLIISNLTKHDGGGIHIFTGNPIIHNCIVSTNIAEDDGGGILIYSGNDIPCIYNCLITDNTSHSYGGGIDHHGGFARIINCNIVGNHSVSYGGGISVRYDCYPEIRNCIIWANTPSSVKNFFGGHASVTYCNLSDSFPGVGNLNSDPLFYSGYLGEFYLSNVQCGQSFNSPCINHGSQLSATECIDLHWEEVCMYELTTRTDQQNDRLTVDMGYHYRTDYQTPTPIPTATPLPTKTPQCPSTGVTLNMPAHIFSPGDTCWLYAYVCNSEPEKLEDHVLLIALEAGGEFWFAPAWTPASEELSYYRRHFPHGETFFSVLHSFTWPTISGNMSGLKFWGAFMNPDMTRILGNIDKWDFGWEE
ncbi:right-handed parallel beta-helix repeat-containing protein [bacterium]|nr:right-handed parallel beta-helix repeat-containing protein [bacterium]